MNDLKHVLPRKVSGLETRMGSRAILKELSSMDVPRPGVAARRRRRRIVFIVATGFCLTLATILLSRLKPAAPSVDRSSVWIDTVKRGPMVRQVRGLGTLVPEDVRW